jgi:tRNA A-37 threonylcarbamoyl transferase component Bud32
MGVVYLARNKLMDRPEVLKVVHKKFLDQPGMAERFLREIRTAARLSHPNIVTAYSALQVGELLVFAMEFVEGEDLAKVIARGPLPVANACYYAQQVALGLQHAFEKGMVHRDIKPQNLILARDGRKHVVKVLDFGLAKVTREKQGATPDLTGVGMMMGTPDYIAPEQTMDAAKADIRADIYSLGCTLHFLLTGCPPFQGKSLYELLQAHHSQEAPPLHQLRAEVPVELSAVVARMMAKDPAKRYQKPVEVAQALMPFVKLGVKALPKEIPTAEGAKAPAQAIPVASSKVQGKKTQVPDSPEAAAPKKPGHIAVRIFRFVISRKMRLLVGALLLAGCALWILQNDVVPGKATREETVEMFNQHGIKGAYGVLHDWFSKETKPLALPLMPGFVAEPVGWLFDSCNSGVAGLILILSGFFRSSRIGWFMWPAAALALVGVQFGIPSIGPLSSSLLALAAGAALAFVGFLVGLEQAQ